MQKKKKKKEFFNWISGYGRSRKGMQASWAAL